MKWYLFAGLIAAIICAVLRAAVIVFTIVTSRLSAMGLRAVAVLAPLPFFLWGAREMYSAFRKKGVDE